MMKCPKCRKLTEIQYRKCSHCGETIPYTVAEKFDKLAESVELALKKELERRRSK